MRHPARPVAQRPPGRSEAPKDDPASPTAGHGRHRRLARGPTAGRHDRSGPGEPHIVADRGDRCRQPAVGARVPGRLAAGVRADAAHLRHCGHHLAGHVRRPAGELGVQGRPEQHLDRELRAQHGARQHPVERGRRKPDEVLLRPHDPLGDQQPEFGDRDGRRELPGRARVPGRLAARLPAIVAPGPGRRWGLHLRLG